MEPNRQAGAAEMQLIEIIRDPGTATAVLKPLRPAILAAQREPASASGLTRRLGISRQRLNHIRELEAIGLVRLVEQRRWRGCVERMMQATSGPKTSSASDVLGYQKEWVAVIRC